MKDIDFLPKWYKHRRCRRNLYHIEYVILGVTFAMMVAWDWSAQHTISQMSAKLEATAGEYEKAEQILLQSSKVQEQITQLNAKAEIITGIIPKSSAKPADVLVELSLLTDERIVLSNVELTAEQTAGSKKKSVRSKKSAIPFGDRRYKLVLSGVALDAADIGQMVCRLEDSPYFCSVTPSISRNKTLKSSTNNSDSKVVTEFKITSYMSNFRQETQTVAKKGNKKQGMQGL